MTDRERFVDCLLGKPVDRAPFWLFWGPWGETWKRWKGEGCSFTDWGEIRAHFGADKPPLTVPVCYGPCPDQSKTLSENEQEIVYLDSWGIQRRNLKHIEGMSEFIKFPVKDRETWERFKAERLDLNHPLRFVRPAADGPDWVTCAKEWMAKDWPIQMGNFPDATVFGGLRWLLGDEECLMAFYTMPELVHEIMQTLTDLFLGVFERIVEAGIRVDVIHIWEDMAGRQGPLISPDHVREFMTPNYLRIKAFATKHAIPLMSVDTDGNPDLIVKPLMEGGMNYLFPMEVAAGTDVRDYQKRYPDLALMGGFDKRALAVGRKMIDAEIERLRPAVEAGRYIPDLDHLVPSDVSWADFCYFAEALKGLGRGR